jgi:tetratricopeptide (TPR) repeat protein
MEACVRISRIIAFLSFERRGAGSLLPFLLFASLVSQVSCNSPAPLSGERKTLSRLLADAEKSSSADDYPATAKVLIRALVLSEEVDPSQNRSIRKRLCDTYLDWARSLYWEGKSTNSPGHLEKAVALCSKAVEVYPRSKRRCEVYAARFKSDLNSIRYKKSTALDSLDPGYNERAYKIDVFRKQARVLRNAGDYMRAKDKLEEILRLDPYDIAATRELRVVMKKVAEAGSRRASADTAGRMAEVAWKNVKPIEREEPEQSAAEPDSAGDLRVRLENYKLAEIDFKDAPLDEAFAMLEKEVRGSISNSFKLKYKDFSPSDSKWPPITFKAENIPVLAAFKSICDALGLSFSLSNDSIEISPK